LWLIKLFELEVSARKICEQIDLSYPTVLKALTVIRMAIVANSPDLQLLAGEIELDEFYFCGKRKGKRGRGAFNKVPVFGILERDGIVKVEVVNDVSAESYTRINSEAMTH
jgi:transposase